MSRLTEGHLVRRRSPATSTTCTGTRAPAHSMRRSFADCRCSRYIYRDIVVDGRGTKPIDPADILNAWTATEFHPEDIGYLTRPVRVDEWLAAVRTRYAFLTNLTADERRWAEGNARYLNEVTAALAPQRIDGQ